MAAPSYLGVGLVVQSTGPITVPWPDDITLEANDVGLLFVESANEAVTLSTPAGFAAVADSPQGVGTAGNAAATRLSVFWVRTTDGSPASPVVADSGARQSAFIMVFRGCIATGDPWDVTAGNTNAGATAVSIPGDTTTVDECLCVMALSNAGGVSDPMVRQAANASLANFATRVRTQPQGTGGGTELKPLGVGVYTGGAVVGRGPDTVAAGDTDPPFWTALHYAPNPNNIIADIATADAKGITLILSLAGNKNQWLDPGTGAFSVTRYVTQLRRFTTPAMSAADAAIITDAMARRRIIVYAMDEPNLDDFATPQQVHQINVEIKAIWPNCLTAMRTSPTILRNGWGGNSMPAGGYTKLDYGWLHYSIAHARDQLTFEEAYDIEQAVIDNNNMNIGLFVTMNMWGGGGLRVDTDGVDACWYVDNDAPTGRFGYIRGNRSAPGTFMACGTISMTEQGDAPITSPDWIRRLATWAVTKPEIPWILYWNHTPNTGSSEFDSYYLRSDFVSAFEDAINTGAARTVANDYRTPK